MPYKDENSDLVSGQNFLTYFPPLIEDVDAIWAMRMEPAEVKELESHQKANWIPGMPEMCWKHLLHSNIVVAKSKYGEAAFSFWPEGWNLPDEYDRLEEHYKSKGEGTEFPIILKPSMQARGNGIRCITAISQLPRDDPFLKIKSVAQHYIPNPILLDGFKVTFRIYVLISSYAPLRAYIYPNGLGRICSHRFTTDLSSFQDLFAHLTNYDINKHNMDDFLENKGDGMDQQGLSTDGLRTDFITVMAYLKRQGHDTDSLWAKMKHVTAMTLLATDEKVSSLSSGLVKYRGTTFEILGFDFLVDDQMNPWILEVNHAPNLEPHTPLETDLKRGMIHDALHLVDFTKNDSPSTYQLTNAIMSAIDSLNSAGLSIDQDLAFMDSFSNACHFPFSSLTRIEAWTLVEAELEAKRLGEWQTVFPLKDSDSSSCLTSLVTEIPQVLYKEGFGGRRNDLAVQFLQLGLSFEQILEMATQKLVS
jgi:hypothetical protein